MKRWMAAWLIAVPGTAVGGEMRLQTVEPYTEKSHPKTVAKWGTKALPAINQLRLAAAEKAGSSKECDRVVVSELSDERSAKPDRFVAFVDCENGKRFYLSRSEAEAPNGAASVQQKSLSRTAAQTGEACRTAIRAKLDFPSTYEESLLKSGERRSEVSGNIVTEIAFTAKNKLNATLPYLGRCIFDDRGLTEVGITGR